MSSASTDSWSQADSDVFSLTSSPMTAALDLEPEGASATTRDALVQTPFEDASAATPAPGVAPKAMKRSKYCMSKDDIFTAVVEDTIFELHSFFFKRESQRFRDLLDNYDGKSEIALPDTTAVDLERFLDLLYPSKIGDYSGKTPDEWMSILRVAYRWGFDSIHKFAIEHLDAVASPVDKIVCARTLGVTDWLVDGYTALCARKETLTLEEGRRLGLEEVICLYDARDDVAERSSKKNTGCLRAVVEQKLEAHGLATPSKTGPQTNVAAKTDVTPTSDTPRSNVHKTAKPSGVASTTQDDDALYTYKPARLDILDQQGQTILGAELTSEVTWRLYPSDMSFHIRREEGKLVVDSPSPDFVYINGRGRNGRIELQHGDVVAFAQRVALSDFDGSIICQPDTGYIVCRDDALESFVEWPKAAWAGRYGNNSNGGEEFKEWKKAINSCDVQAQAFAARSFCLLRSQPRATAEQLESLQKEIDATAEQKKSHILKTICAALLHARKPLTVEGWQIRRE